MKRNTAKEKKKRNKGFPYKRITLLTKKQALKQIREEWPTKIELTDQELLELEKEVSEN